MRKKVIISIILIFILTISTAAAQGFSLRDLERVRVLWNGNELSASSNDTAVVLNNRVYVPAYLLRQAKLTVQLNNNTLSIIDSKTKYINNLHILNKFQTDYFDSFAETDKEALRLLGNIILKERVDSTKIEQLIASAENGIKEFDDTSLAIIGDRPDNLLSEASLSAESYRKAINSLLNYGKTGSEADLEAFYKDREKASAANNLAKSVYNDYFNLSLEKALH
ncbi:hypothetical protein [Paenibacillus caui]|uniref:hypothetical protein n=1 Tax=Paenibacillus caui TaxID=2873927 RepID=UPI001CA82B2E|nr:hypothetical protein [Paenibacillus caui]